MIGIIVGMIGILVILVIIQIACCIALLKVREYQKNDRNPL